jgi:hypothetical protein
MSLARSTAQAAAIGQNRLKLAGSREENKDAEDRRQ